MPAKRHYSRIARPPGDSFFMFGVRGVGKSSWARTHFPDAHRVDLLDEARYQRLLADPGLLADELRALPSDSWVILDEVQRIPPLLNEVHRSIEESALRFVLLGSSARKLKTAGTNLLAGRALWRKLFPFTPEELADDFSLEAVLRHGSIPVIWSAQDRRKSLEAYVQLYLREEVQAEALVRNLPGFLRFLPVAALFHGQTVNVSNIARDAGTARTTISGYLEILDDTLMTMRLPAFEARLRARERKHPKLYWIDPGVVRAVKRQFGPVGAEERGPLFEGWVLTILRAYAEEHDLYEDIAYWAPAQAKALEVDFLLRRGSELLAVEAKSGRRFSRSWLAGMNAIAELDNLVRRVVVYTGAELLRTSEGVDVMPVEAFCGALAADELWP